MIINIENLQDFETWCPKAQQFIWNYIRTENDKVRLKLKPFRESILFTINNKYFVKISFRGNWTIECSGTISFNMDADTFGDCLF